MEQKSFGRMCIDKIPLDAEPVGIYSDRETILDLAFFTMIHISLLSIASLQCLCVGEQAEWEDYGRLVSNRTPVQARPISLVCSNDLLIYPNLEFLRNKQITSILIFFFLN